MQCVRLNGIEPVSFPYQGSALPLSYRRMAEGAGLEPAEPLSSRISSAKGYHYLCNLPYLTAGREGFEPPQSLRSLLVQSQATLPICPSPNLLRKEEELNLQGFLQLSSLAKSFRHHSICPSTCGAGGSRTPKTWFLRPVRMPIPSPRHDRTCSPPRNRTWILSFAGIRSVH